MKNLKTNPLKYVFENDLVLDGTWVEFGVFKGDTINYISKHTHNTVYGFDTFTGLPEEWILSDTFSFDSGHYSYEDFADKNNLQKSFPKVNENVNLIKGLFADTLPLFLKDQQITFIHIDCDVYKSTVDVFNYITPYVKDGCIIVFDEFINYPNYDMHEYLAFNEWVKKHNIEYECIGINGKFFKRPKKIYDKEFQKAAIRITKNPKKKI